MLHGPQSWLRWLRSQGGPVPTEQDPGQARLSYLLCCKLQDHCPPTPWPLTARGCPGMEPGEAVRGSCWGCAEDHPNLPPIPGWVPPTQGQDRDGGIGAERGRRGPCGEEVREESWRGMWGMGARCGGVIPGRAGRPWQDWPSPASLPTTPLSVLRPQPCCSSLVGPSAIRAAGLARRRGGGELRARGECSNKRFISETKAYFFRQDCLCGYLMTQRLGQGPGRAGQRGAARRSSGPSPPAPSVPAPPYLVLDIKAGLCTKRKQQRDERTPPISSRSGEGPPRAGPLLGRPCGLSDSVKYFAQSSL